MKYGDYIPMRPIRKLMARESPVDIILPYYDECEKVLELCKGIWTYTPLTPYKLYVVDDYSRHKTFIYTFRKTPFTTIIRNDARLGFGASLYEGFKVSNNPWVVFLHSDCKIDRPTWLTDLFASYYNLANYRVGMVAPRTNNPLVKNQGLKAESNAQPIADMILKEGYLPLYCVLCRRDLFNKVGGFIKPYPFRGYEDEELAIRMRKHGYLQGISGRSWIFHEGSATVKKIPNYSVILEKNRDLCLQDLRSK
jgi:GT2 family glycosyltransferase